MLFRKVSRANLEIGNTKVFFKEGGGEETYKSKKANWLGEEPNS